jgi:polyhydroxybutyrate depolymerase
MGGSAGAGGEVATGGISAIGGSAGAGGSGGAGESAPGCGNTAAPKGARNLTIQVNGKARTYVLFVPTGYDPKKSIPLIFAWHSSGADGAESRRYYKLEPVTGDGAIIVYPDGLNGAWDLSANGADMKFFDLLLESISKDYCVDQARVFSTGYSFGGMMSNSLACSRGSKLRAFAPMAGAFFDGTKSCATPVPAWIAHATNDNLVTYASGQAARDIWLKTNGCGTTTMPTSPTPCVAYQCSKAPVNWCVHSDGHVWPNFASKGVWDFFKSL